jgi:hypothetical protein
VAVGQLSNTELLSLVPGAQINSLSLYLRYWLRLIRRPFASSSSIVVDHSHCHLMVEGSSPSAAAGTEIEKKAIVRSFVPDSTVVKHLLFILRA